MTADEDLRDDLGRESLRRARWEAAMEARVAADEAASRQRDAELHERIDNKVRWLQDELHRLKQGRPER